MLHDSINVHWQTGNAQRTQRQHIIEIGYERVFSMNKKRTLRRMDCVPVLNRISASEGRKSHKRRIKKKVYTSIVKNRPLFSSFLNFTNFKQSKNSWNKNAQSTRHLYWILLHTFSQGEWSLWMGFFGVLNNERSWWWNMLFLRLRQFEKWFY